MRCRRGPWFGRFGSREDGAHGRKLDSLPLHHPPGSPLWKGVGHGTCNDSCNQNGELYSLTGLESPAIQGNFRGGKLCVRGCAIPHGDALVESGESVEDFMIPALRSLVSWKANKRSSPSLRMKVAERLGVYV